VDVAPNRRILLQRQVCPDLIVIFLIRNEQMPKMSLTEDDNVVKTIPSDRADEPLHIPVLPGRLSRDRSIPDAHRSKPPDECSAIRAIAIANDVAWWLVPATGLSQLTGKPLGIGMGCHAYTQKLSARMSQDKKSIQQPKRDGRNDEHIHRRDGIGVIVKKGLPALRRWPPSLCHVFRHRRLADLNASTVEALKQTLLGAESIAQPDASARPRNTPLIE
jgi:hypothetical protein